MDGTANYKRGSGVRKRRRHDCFKRVHEGVQQEQRGGGSRQEAPTEVMMNLSAVKRSSPTSRETNVQCHGNVDGNYHQSIRGFASQIVNDRPIVTTLAVLRRTVQCSSKITKTPSRNGRRNPSGRRRPENQLKLNSLLSDTS